MIRFFSIVFAFVCGLIGWKLGTPGGISRAYVASVLGTAVASSSAAYRRKRTEIEHFSQFQSPNIKVPRGLEFPVAPTVRSATFALGLERSHSRRPSRRIR
jgi:hypothetical protein